jgi:formate hydrogenlyase subunit 3/multisubunit Na+/H+ antiporter MnhD subunit
MSHLWVALAIAFNEAFSFFQIHLYLSGVLVGGIIGYMLLLQTKRLENNLNLHQFHGLSFKHPKLAMAFLLCCLSISGFPISPSFIGEDLIFSHIHQGQILIAFMVALIFLIDGIALIRLYARIFLGPHAKAQADMAFRSA